MAVNEVKFKCLGCAQENTASLDTDLIGKSRVILYCCKCGKVNEPTGINQSDKSGNWLSCIVFQGIESKDTRGPIQSRTGETLWGEAAAGNITREDFMNKHGYDPWTIWCSTASNQGKPICQGYTDRCKKKIEAHVWKPPHELPQPGRV